MQTYLALAFIYRPSVVRALIYYLLASGRRPDVVLLSSRKRSLYPSYLSDVTH